ncbi:3-phosphoserine/phosphohydroxythreonine transaminase [Myroides sp. LJL119]
MEKVHNFCAGPCLLDQSVYQKSAQAILDYQQTGISILSMSHRSVEFQEILAKAKSLALELLGLSIEHYDVLFLQGGASMEFLRVPCNLLQNKAAYLNTGIWSGKAIQQAKEYGQVDVLYHGEDSNYSHITSDLHFQGSYDYLHYTSNNTIYGTQFKQIPTTVDIPVVCDMSSDIYSRELDFNQIDLIYAGAQKNIGPAGVSLVIIKKNLLGKTTRRIAAMLDYQKHIEQGSLYHTANVFGIYTCMLNFQWLKQKGGVAAIEKVNNQKAALLYEQLDKMDFVRGFAQKDSRSKMNVTWEFIDPKHNAIFDQIAQQANIVNIKGHRLIGGYRASLYNAVSLQSVEVLIQALQQISSRV